MHKIGSPGRLLAVVAVVFAGMTGHAVADSSSGGFSKRVAGSYLIDHDGSDSRDVITLGADGVFLLTSSDAGEFNFGESQGVWKRSGRRTIAAKVVNFDFDYNGTAIVRFDISFDRRFRVVTGDFSGAVIPNAVADPLNAKDVPPQFADGFSGQRIKSWWT